jgi:hypothetical protein
MMCRFRQIIDVVIVNNQSERMRNPAVVTLLLGHECGIYKEILHMTVIIIIIIIIFINCNWVDTRWQWLF